MGARIGYAVVSMVLVVYFGFVAHRGVVLIRHGTWVSVALGAAALVLPLIGAWFLWHSTRFAQQASRLARELDAEGGLPVDDLPRAPSGRVDRDAADAVFAERRKEVEASPGDWRTWFRLAVAYHDARDTARGRHAMRRAIDLHAGKQLTGDPRP